eukprot:315100-Chlamydomonas_euryale.AAC.8
MHTCMRACMHAYQACILLLPAPPSCICMWPAGTPQICIQSHAARTLCPDEPCSKVPPVVCQLRRRIVAAAATRRNSTAPCRRPPPPHRLQTAAAASRRARGIGVSWRPRAAARAARMPTDRAARGGCSDWYLKLRQRCQGRHAATRAACGGGATAEIAGSAGERAADARDGSRGGRGRRGASGDERRRSRGVLATRASLVWWSTTDQAAAGERPAARVNNPARLARCVTQTDEPPGAAQPSAVTLKAAAVVCIEEG